MVRMLVITYHFMRSLGCGVLLWSLFMLGDIHVSMMSTRRDYDYYFMLENGYQLIVISCANDGIACY